MQKLSDKIEWSEIKCQVLCKLAGLKSYLIKYNDKQVWIHKADIKISGNKVMISTHRLESL